MKLSLEDFKELLFIGENAAIKAGKIIEEKAQGFKVLANKMGSTDASSVLTEVDLLSQNSILNDLEESIQRYDLGLLAEESEDDKTRLIKDFFWCIDPMDGTLSFINGNHGYSVSLSLISREGLPYVGIIYDPVKGDLYSSIKGEGVNKNGEAFKLPEPKDALTIVFDNSFYKSSNYSWIIERLTTVSRDLGYKEINIIDNKGAVLNAISVLESSPGFYFKFTKPTIGGGAIWDFASTALFFDELESFGFNVCDSTGKSLNFNSPKSIYFNESGIIYSSCNQLKSEIIKLQNLITKDSV